MLTLDEEKFYTISFITGKGTQVPPITEKAGNVIEVPEDPTREGYTFAGWDQEIPELMPDHDMIITAKWTRNVTVGTYLPLKARMKKAGGKLGNPTTVWTDRTGVTLAAGRSRKISATTEKLIDHRRDIRFESGNPQIASVTLNGRITAVQPGVTYVYAYAQNGVFKRIRVTVVK